jgi:hypothetical protein
VGQQVDQIAERLDEMEQFTLAQDQSATQQKRIIDAVQQHRKWMVEQVRPHIRAEAVDAASQGQRLEEAVKAAHADAETISQLLSGVRQQAGDAGAARLSIHYRGAAETHRDSARIYRWALIGSLVLTFIAVLWLFLWYPPPLETSEASASLLWGNFIRQLVYRLLLLGVLTYLVAFFARNYRTERHLQILNEAKQSGLDTFSLFQDATADDATRAVILAELVRSVFLAPETGLIAESGERTVLEMVPGLQSLFASRVS